MSDGLTDLAVRRGVDEAVAREFASLGYAEAVERYAGAQRPGTDAVAERVLPMEGAVYREAMKQGMTLTAYLEELDPSEPGEPMDAFQRQMKRLGIRTQSNRGLGIAASKLEDLYNAEDGRGATLVPEFFNRCFRFGAIHGMAGVKTMQQRFYSSNNPVSEVLEPTWIDSTIRGTKLRPSILPELVALEVGIDDDSFKAFYLTDDAASERMVRVEQGDEIPSARLTGADRTIRLYKYGRALEIPYEVSRRYRLDIVAFHIARIGARTQVDKEQVAYETLRDGDGNSNGATEYRQVADLGGTNTGVVEFYPLVRFFSKFQSPLYNPTIGIGDETWAARYYTSDVGTANPLVFLGAGSPFQATGQMRELPGFPTMYARSYATANHGLFVDGSQALGMLFEVGANLTETNRIIRRQTDEVVLTEVNGFWVIDSAASYYMGIDD